jgi:hypothetical protein
MGNNSKVLFWSPTSNKRMVDRKEFYNYAGSFSINSFLYTQILKRQEFDKVNGHMKSLGLEV